METRTVVTATILLLWTATSSLALEVGIGGASVSVGDGKASAGVGRSRASVGAGGASVSVGDAADEEPSKEEGAVPDAVQDAAKTRSVRSSGDSTQFGLPAELRPAGTINCPTKTCETFGDSSGSGSDGVGLLADFFSSDVLSACRETVVEAAQAYGMVDVTVSRHGPPRRLTDGGQLAHIFTRITYRHENGYEVRQAPIWCRLDDAGAVSALLDN